MESERWERAKEIFEQAMEIAPVLRERFLDDACSGDPVVRQEVEELLCSYDVSDEFMERPAASEVAREIVGAGSKLDIGRMLLHYEIIAPLGEGGMGEVYLARDTKLGRRVAIKVLPSNSVESEEANGRLLREAQSAAKLDHPNICTIHEISGVDGRQFIVMQYVEGKSLAAKIKDGSLTGQESIHIAAQIANALATAHSSGIIHRDIKPANIIINEKGEAKILDFGLAKQVTKGGIGAESATAEMFSTKGAVLGTVPYMSPEQVKGEKLDGRTDIFSVGAMLYEMFSGTQPFRRDNNAETIAAILNHEPPIDTIPAELTPIITKCIAKDKNERFSDANDLASNLKSVRNVFGIETSTIPIRSSQNDTNTLRIDGRNSAAIAADTGSITLPLTRKFKIAAVLIAIIAFGGIATLSYFASRNRNDAPAVVSRLPINSLAVLPFENVNPDTEYLSDGVAESLINSLSDLPNLRVISRATVFGFKGKKETAAEVGKELNVEAILTGKFSQIGDIVTIQAELTDLTTNSQLWGERFNVKLSELFEVQEQIAKQITDKLQIKLDNEQKAQIAKHYTDNPDAYREYLKGRFYSLQYTPDGHKKALEHLNKAIEMDPTYALAYAGLADAYTTASDGLLPPREALTKAKSASQKAIDLDDKLAEAWAAHGHARLHEWDKGAIDDLNKAIELSPSSMTTQLWLGEYYLIWDVERSIKILEKAGEIDPLSPLPPSLLSFAYYMLRQPDKSIDIAKKALEIDPKFFTEHTYLARFYAFSGDLKSAKAELDKIPPEAADVFVISTRGAISAFEGKRSEAEKATAELEKLSAKQYVSPIELAFVYNVLDERDKTFFYLERSFEDRSENLSFIRNLPDYDKVRNDPRYSDLIRRMGF